MQPARPIQVHGKPLGDGTVPAIITPLVGRTATELLEEVAVIAPKRPDLLEWRVDYFSEIGDAAQVIETARAIRAASNGIPLLLTRRSAAEGGQPVTIPEADVVALYAAACAARCVDLIDYELSNARADIERLRAVSAEHGVALILSFHDFERTPDATTLGAKFGEAERLGADVAKVAVTPNDPHDVLVLLEATYRATQALRIPVLSMSMGGIGSLSRLMGWAYGSAATFAVGRSASAPGQIAIEELRTALAIVRRAVGD